MLQTGTQIGTYRIDAPLGAGGMGRVYRAMDTKLNRPAAIKFLPEDLADADARRRFQREAQMVSSLNHPHIVTVYDAGEYRERQYLITELVDGGTLRDWAAERPRGWRQIAELLTGVADGLATAHDAGILHCDLKPENILIAKNGYAKLADFGLAKLVEQREPAVDGASSDRHTRLGLLLGTVAYMSPEQAAGLPLDVRSDVFSFGIVLYELLAGHRPFVAENDVALLRDIVHAAVPPLPAGFPAELCAIVDKALEKDPAYRYQTMRDFVVDLRRLVRRSAPDAPASGSRELTERRERVRRTLLAKRTRRGAGGKLGYRVVALGVLAVVALFLMRDYFLDSGGGVPDGGSATVAPERAASDGTLTPEPQAAPRNSLAVLPFVSFSADPDQEYFSDGISEELLNTLANIPGLRVPSRTSSFTFKGTNTDVRAIAEVLNVDHVLEGSVRKSGNQVRITAQLIDVATDSHLWSATYDRELVDVFAMQDEIAASVAEALEIRLLPSRDVDGPTSRTESIAAHDAYLLGLYYLRAQRSADIFTAVDSFERAIELDPNYAAAHALLASSLFTAQTYGLMSLDETRARAKLAIAAAVELDPNLGESIFARGQLAFAEGDFAAADSDFTRAIELNPNLAIAYGNRATVLGALNRPTEGRAALEKALELDPLNALFNWRLGNVLLSQGDIEQATAYYRRAAAIEPSQPNAYAGLGDAAIMAGHLDEALLRYLEGLQQDPGQAHMTAIVGYVYRSLGDVERAQLWFDRASGLVQGGSLPRFFADFTMLVVRHEDPAALLAVLLDVPAQQLPGLSARLFRKAALSTRDRTGIETFYRRFWPELFAAEPRVNVENVGAATDIVWLMLRGGETGRADRLLADAVEIVGDPKQRSMRPPEWAQVMVEIEALALQGREAEALAAMRRAVDGGWRLDWWQVEADPTLDSISDDPAFRAMLEEVKADLARQLARVRELERAGTIPLPEGL
jgi:serine/threonine-protein kinase